MWRGLALLSSVSIGLAAATIQEKANVPSADVIEARQESMDMSSITLHGMSDAVKAGREAKTQAYAAAALAKWAKTLPAMFPAGTGQSETSTNSQALGSIWQDRQGFERAASSYAQATADLAAFAAANDTARFTKQLDQVNSACSSCHGRYKAGAQGPPQK
jgi:cytochrome c556